MEGRLRTPPPPLPPPVSAATTTASAQTTQNEVINVRSIMKAGAVNPNDNNGNSATARLTFTDSSES